MAKTSLQAALRNAGPAKKPEPAAEVAPAAELDDAATAQAPLTKKLIVEIPRDAYYQIDKMRLEMRRESIKGLVVEALNDLFKKHGYPPIA